MVKKTRSVKKESLTSRALESSFWEALGSIAQRLGGIIFVILIARILLPEGFGVYTLSMSIVSIFFMFAQGGIDRTLVVYLSNTLDSEEKKRGYFKYILKIKLLAALFFALILLITAYPLTIFFFKKEVLFIPVLLSGLFTFIFIFDQFFGAAFFAIQRVKYRFYKEVIYQISRIGILVLIFFLVYHKSSINLALLSLIIAVSISLIYSVYKFHSLLPSLFRGESRLPSETKSKILRFLFYININLILLVLMSNIDNIMLGWLIKDTAYIGIYSSAFILVSSLSGLLSFTYVLLPIFVQTKRKNLENSFNRVFKYIMILTVPASFGLASLGSYFIVLIYGYEYIGARLPLYFLSFMFVLTIPATLLAEVFSARKKPRDFLLPSIIAIVINITLNYVLITSLSKFSQNWAITGAAIAVLVSWLIYCLMLFISVKKSFGIKIRKLSIIRPVIAALVMFLVVYFLKVLFKDINLFNGILLVLAGVLSYFFVLFVIKGINKEDYILIDIVRQKFLAFLHQERQNLANIKSIIWEPPVFKSRLSKSDMKKRILNLGCGTDFYGTDRLDFSKTIATTLVHDLEKPLPFPNNTFDEVKAHAVFEHLKNNGKFIEEIYRVLKKGGKLDLTTCNAGYILFHVKNDHNSYLEREDYMKTRHPDDFHRHLFVPSHLKAWFKKFKNVKVTYLLRNRKGIKKLILRLIPFKMGYEALHVTAEK